MSKQIVVNISGSEHSGKTLLMEKIAAMLKSEGIDDVCVLCPDGDFGKFEEAALAGERVPTLKSVFDRDEVSVVLEESVTSTFRNKRVMGVNQMTLTLKKHSMKHPIVLLTISNEDFVSGFTESLPEKIKTTFQVIIVKTDFRDIPEILENKPLFFIRVAPENEPYFATMLITSGMPAAFPFLTKYAAGLKLGGNSIVVHKDTELYFDRETSLSDWYGKVLKLVA